MLIVDCRVCFSGFCEHIVCDIAGIGESAITQHATLAEGVERIDAAGAFACVGFVLGQDKGFVGFQVADLCHRGGIVMATTAGGSDERHGGRL